jgi:hypothetical protein
MIPNVWVETLVELQNKSNKSMNAIDNEPNVVDSGLWSEPRLKLT